MLFGVTKIIPPPKYMEIRASLYVIKVVTSKPTSKH